MSGDGSLKHTHTHRYLVVVAAIGTEEVPQKSLDASEIPRHWTESNPFNLSLELLFNSSEGMRIFGREQTFFD